MLISIPSWLITSYVFVLEKKGLKIFYHHDENQFSKEEFLFLNEPEDICVIIMNNNNDFDKYWEMIHEDNFLMIINENAFKYIEDCLSSLESYKKNNIPINTQIHYITDILYVVYNKNKEYIHGVINMSINDLFSEIESEYNILITDDIKEIIVNERYCPLNFFQYICLGGNIQEYSSNNKNNVIENIMKEKNTVTTCKYLESIVWNYFVSERNNNILGSFNEKKALLLFQKIIEFSGEYDFLEKMNNSQEIILLPFIKLELFN